MLATVFASRCVDAISILGEPCTFCFPRSGKNKCQGCGREKCSLSGFASCFLVLSEDFAIEIVRDFDASVGEHAQIREIELRHQSRGRPEEERRCEPVGRCSVCRNRPGGDDIGRWPSSEAIENMVKTIAPLPPIGCGGAERAVGGGARPRSPSPDYEDLQDRQRLRCRRNEA